MQLTEHSNIIHKSEQKHSCSECCVSFSTLSQLSKHQKAKHLKKTFQCQHCDSTFTSNSNLKDHISNIHKTRKPRIVCHVCGLLQGVCKCEKVESPKKSDDKASCPVCGKQMLARNLSSHLQFWIDFILSVQERGEGAGGTRGAARERRGSGEGAVRELR